VVTNGYVNVPSGITLVLESGSLLALEGGDVKGGGTVQVTNGAELAGTGGIVGTLKNEGTVSLGYGDALNPWYGYQQGPTGILQVYIRGTGSGNYGWLFLNQVPATLAGNLKVILEGYTPSVGDSFRFLWTKDSTINGWPTSFDFPLLGGGKEFAATKEGTDTGRLIVQSTGSVDLSLTKTASTTTPTVGDNVTFTVSVKNSGPDAATTITITDKLASGLDFVSAIPTPSSGSYDANSGDWTISNLAKDATATLQLVAKVTSITAVVNEAKYTTSTPGDPTPPTTPKVTLVPKPKPQEADVYVTKTVDDDTPRPLDSVKFTVTVGNNGPDAATGVVVTDTPLSDGLSYNSAMPSQGTFNKDRFVWTVGGLAVGQTETLVLDMTVSRAGEHVNRAEVTSSSPTDPNPGNNEDEMGVYAEQADLSVTKTVDDNTPYNGQTVTFTVTLKNDGPDGSGQVKVKDLLPAGLTLVSATPSEGLYDSSTGLWSVNALRNGFTATLTLVASVSQSGTLTNTAQVWQAAKYDPDSDPGNNVEAEDDQQTVTLTAPVTADLRAAMTADKATGDLGAAVRFTLTVTNDGPETATGVTVKDLLPSGLTLASATPSAGTYTSGTGIWSVGSLTNGATATLTLTATIAGAGTLTNTAQVQSSAAYDPDSAAGNSAAAEDDQATVTVTVGLGVTGVAPDNGKQGQTLNVTLAGKNFLSGASADFGAGVTVNQVNVDSATQLTTNVTLATNADLGKRDVTVTNTDGGSATLTNGFEVTDGTPPSVLGCTARGRSGLDIQFSEPVNQTEVLDKANLDLRAPADSSTPVDLTNAVLTYDAATNTLKVDGLDLPPGRTYQVTLSNVRDLADNVGDPSACSCNGTVPALWTHLFPEGLSLITIPWECSQINPASLFNLSPAQFRMADWGTTRGGEPGNYVYFDGTTPRFELGEGRWINLTEPTLAALGEGQAEAAPTGAPFVLPVNKGWFLIGNPWLEDLPWSLDQIRVLEDGVDRGSLANQLNKTFEQRLVEPYCYPWDGEYKFTFDPAYARYLVPGPRTGINDTLKTYAGAFMHINRDNLSLSFAPATTARNAAAVSRDAAPAAGWTVSLQAMSGDLKDAALFGVSDAAGRAGAVPFQAKKPPQVSARWLELALTDDALRACNQIDTRAAAGPVTWRAAVRSSEPNREVVLTWPDLSSVPRDASLILVDELTGKRQTMRTTASYRFRTGAAGEVRTFRLEAAPAGAGRLIVTGVTVTPTRSGFALQYTLSQDAEVAIRLVSPTGRAVATLSATRSRGGPNVAALPTRTDAGQALPRGVYLVELQAAAEDGRRAKAVRSVAVR